MDEKGRAERLKIALVMIGALFTIGFYPLVHLWPDSWAWSNDQSPYLTMMLGIYMVLGAMLMLAAHHPEQNMSLIWFTIFSSIVHGCIMSVQAYVNPEHWGHFYGEVPIMFFIAAVLLYLRPRDASESEPSKAKVSSKKQ